MTYRVISPIHTFTVNKGKLTVVCQLQFSFVFTHHFYQVGSLSLHMPLIVINPFPNKPCFLCVCSTSLWKTLWDEEKLIVTSTFSFSHSVFCWFGELLPFSSNLKLSSANSVRFVESKIVVWERVNWANQIIYNSNNSHFPTIHSTL